MLAERLSELWCDFMHDSPMWPIHGHYQCRTCGRLYRVPWTESHEEPRQASVPPLMQALAGGHR
jgi:hypothetical protein